MKKHSKIIKTLMMKRYMIKLLIRVMVFVIVLVGYLFDRERLIEFMIQPITMGVTPLHLLWMMFMVMMLFHIFPTDKLTMALRKSEKRTYEETPEYSKEELYDFVRNQNIRAWIVMLVWLVFNAIFGLLYVQDIINEADLFMLTVFYFLSDYICILFFCPFQTFIMKNHSSHSMMAMAIHGRQQVRDLMINSRQRTDRVHSHLLMWTQTMSMVWIMHMMTAIHIH